MPMPLSTMLTTTAPAAFPVALTTTCGVRPAGTNLIALEMTFWNSIVSRVSWPSTPGIGSTSTRAEHPETAACNDPSACATTCSSARGSSTTRCDGSSRAKLSTSSSIVRSRSDPLHTCSR